MGEVNFLKKNRKGQVTIFIIIALIIVVLGALIYAFYPQVSSRLTGGVQSPAEFIQVCMEEEIENNINLVSSQGGSINPEHYFLYDDSKVEYLCYTEKNYESCIMQQPFLKPHIEEELKQEITAVSKDCFDSLKQNYENRGYDVSLTPGDINVQLLPGKVAVIFNNELTLTKGSAERYGEFSIILNNNLYEFVGITNSILSYETKYGDAETTLYMNFYHDLKVEKKKQGDGTTVYILTNRDNGNKFQFASRSIVWPSGYSL